MMRRFSIFRSFQSTPASQGQHWLPLVALALVSFECNAAVDGEARVQISRQQTQLAQLQNQVRSLDTWGEEPAQRHRLSAGTAVGIAVGNIRARRNPGAFPIPFLILREGRQ